MTYTLLIELLIVSSISNLANVFVFYPIVVWIFSFLFKKPLKTNPDYQPNITVVIAAYNEENNIQDAIRSVYNSNYPQEKIRVIVGSDGSTDRTADKVKYLQSEYGSLDFFEYDRAGKNLTLNKLVPQVSSELLFYMDADVIVDNDAIRSMVLKMSDEKVGSVLSNIKYINKELTNTSAGTGESAYHKFDSMIKIFESNISSTVSPIGPFYCVKANLCDPIPNLLVCDDFYRILSVIKQRKRVIFDQYARTFETRAKSNSEEIKRRIRTVSGGMAAIWANKALLGFGYGWVSFFLWTHKINRWLSPIYLFGVLLLTLILPAESLIKHELVVGQTILYSLAFLGWLFDKMKIKLKLFQLPYYVISTNFSFLIGTYQFFVSKNNSVWSRIDTN